MQQEASSAHQDSLQDDDEEEPSSFSFSCAAVTVFEHTVSS